MRGRRHGLLRRGLTRRLPPAVATAPSNGQGFLPRHRLGGNLKGVSGDRRGDAILSIASTESHGPTVVYLRQCEASKTWRTTLDSVWPMDRSLSARPLNAMSVLSCVTFSGAKQIPTRIEVDFEHLHFGKRRIRRVLCTMGSCFLQVVHRGQYQRTIPSPAS